jgi:hypothetical protein
MVTFNQLFTIFEKHRLKTSKVNKQHSSAHAAAVEATLFVLFFVKHDGIRVFMF